MYQTDRHSGRISCRIKTIAFRTFAVIAMLLVATGASAQSIDDAVAAFDAGDFLEAADIGEAVGTSNSLALAARSLGVYAHYLATENDRMAILDRAMGIAEAAVRADSMNPEAYYQHAHVVGRYAENIGKMKALREGVAGEIRDLLEHALALEPDMSEAHLALGGWHAEIATAGRIARWMYKGGREEAIMHLDRALALEPESKVVLFEYAIRLAVLDDEDATERIRGMLERAADLPVKDAYDEIMHAQILARLGNEDGN